MYQHNSRQLEIEDFKTPFRTPLDPNNRWVKLAALIPWDFVEEQYQKKLGRAREGKRAYSSRLAFGALIIKERLRLTDEETVVMITENHYLQWFIGFQEFQIKAPFNDSLMTHFRKRLPVKVIKKINNRIGQVQKKPRTYRKEARKAFLNIQKKRQPGWKKLRKAMRKQLGYVRRDLGYLDNLLDEVGFGLLSNSQYRKLVVIREVYRQQQEMYDEKKHTISSRIISISQPHVRSIKRNKTGAKWEFGAKVSVGIVDGFTTIYRIGWDNFNESLDLQGQIKEHHRTHGCWPENNKTRTSACPCDSRNQFMLIRFIIPA